MKTTVSLFQHIQTHLPSIHDWLSDLEASMDLPLYTSVDIRDAEFKCAVIDTNLFPAGFNNLCDVSIKEAAIAFKKAILDKVPKCRRILIFSETHTRNTWYLENIRVLEKIIKDAGFSVLTATLLEDPKTEHITLKTATSASLIIHNLIHFLTRPHQFDMILLNNDLTSGIPSILKDTHLPIYPPPQMGWFSRLKSRHFSTVRPLIDQLTEHLHVDPWIFSCLFTSMNDMDIHRSEDRIRLADAASDLLKQITQKYHEHRIDSSPYLFLKSDFGTYGIGVHTIKDANEILHFNRKIRNKLAIGKSATPIHQYLLQEGVPTIYTINGSVGEICVYKIGNQFVGAFYRVHSSKTIHDNLNSPGMSFQKICHFPKHGKDAFSPVFYDASECGLLPEKERMDLYCVLARIAGIAASRENSL